MKTLLQFVAVTWAAVVPAQVIHERIPHITGGDVTVSGDGKISYPFRATATTPSWDAVWLEAATNVGITGDATFFTSGNIEYCIVCGDCANASGVGKVAVYSRPVGQTSLLQLHSQKTMGGKSIVGAAYDTVTSTLYLLDAVSDSILLAGWGPNQPISSASFSTWATSTQVAALADADSKQLELVNDEVAVMAGDYAVDSDPRLRPHVRVDEIGGNIIWSNWTPVADPVVDVAVVPESVDDLGTSVTVHGVGGTVFEVHELSVGAPIIIGAGVIPVGLDETTISLFAGRQFEVGRRYVIEDVANGTDPEVYGFECIRRVGVSAPLSPTLSMSAIALSSSNEPLGQLWCAVGFDSGDPDENGGIQALPAAILLNMGEVAPGNDPIVNIGGTLMLDPGTSTGAVFTAYHNFKSGTGLASHSLIIPDDPALIGRVVLAQFLVDDGTNAVFSQIGGALIHLPQPI